MNHVLVIHTQQHFACTKNQRLCRPEVMLPMFADCLNSVQSTLKKKIRPFPQLPIAFPAWLTHCAGCSVESEEQKLVSLFALAKVCEIQRANTTCTWWNIN